MKIDDNASMFANLKSGANKRPNNNGSEFGQVFSGIGDNKMPDAKRDELDLTSRTDGARSEKEATEQARRQEDIDELHRWAKMNPAEMVRAKYLAAHDLTEDSLSRLSADERKMIEDEIRKQIEEQAKNQSDGASEALSALSV